MLNLNGKHHLEYAVPSVLKTDYSNYRLILIDNASTDDSVAWVRASQPAVHIIVNDRNLAWAGGNNVGVRHALEQGAEWVVLINNDILVDPRWLTETVKVAAADPRIGLIGFEVYGEYLKTPREDFHAASERYQELTFRDTEVIVGCALMVRADVFQQIGLFDEVYFIYGEEDDFEARARRAGYRLVRTNIPLWHYSEGWGGQMRLRSGYLALRNGLRLGLKAKGFGVWRTVHWIAWAYYFSCSPFVRVDRANALQRRARPSNPFVNFWLVSAAIAWNLLHLGETLACRRRDEARAAAARRVLEQRFGLLPGQA
jgi:hypothetical protein